MSLKPSPSNCYVIIGRFPVFAQFGEDYSTLVDKEFSLKIVVPATYPDDLPIVYELERDALIPTSPEYHKNDDSSLCLGSPLALFTQLSQNASLVSFAQTCIIPHLVSAILKKEKGISFKQGELKHYNEGLEEDIAERIGIRFSLDSARQIFSLLGKKKRIANRDDCPCGKGKKLGACSCSIHRLISAERKKEGYSRRFFRNVARYYNHYLKRQEKNPERKIKSISINSDWCDAESCL